MCKWSMLLNEGRIVTMGDTEKVINDYLVLLLGENTTVIILTGRRLY